MATDWQGAREAVHRRYARTFTDRDVPYAVADYGAEDATAFQVVHGPAEVVTGQTVPLGGVEGDGATLVDKATGRVSWVPWISGGWERVAGMVRFGRWPA